jgi:hypothetical protein
MALRHETTQGPIFIFISKWRSCPPCIGCEEPEAQVLVDPNPEVATEPLQSLCESCAKSRFGQAWEEAAVKHIARRLINSE